MQEKIKEYLLLTIGTVCVVLGVYFFKFPNHFIFGGVTGMAVIIEKITPLSASSANLWLNLLFLILGFLFLGRNFGVKTIYTSVLLSILISVLEKLYPMNAPFTNQPVLEFAFAIILPAVGSAILFHCEASGGGTDIIAMILKKYSGTDIGGSLFAADLLITVFGCFLFDITTGLFSILGLIVKSILIDNTISSMHRSKYVHIICEESEPICDFILKELGKSATICEGKGAYSKKEKYVVITALKPKQAVKLRKFIKEENLRAFVLVFNTSEVFGKGFLNMNS